jgi:orotate phosphoribosyltransferase
MNNDTEVSSKIAEYLLQTEAVKLNLGDPFIWSSGWNSPIYCDNRITLSYPELRTYIKKAFAQKIKENYPNCTALVGVATAGIALGALIADEMGIPFAYCRPEPKKHGLKNQLEGRLAPDAKIVVIEDLISTGGSSLKVVDYLRNDGHHILGMGAIFTYQIPLAQENFDKYKCSYFTLSNYSELVKTAGKTGYIKTNEIEQLQEWANDPSAWKK